MCVRLHVAAAALGARARPYASAGARAARRVAQEVAQAHRRPRGDPTRNREVHVVIGRLERDPSVGREIGLDPRMRVVAANDVAVNGGVELAGPESADEPGRNAQRPQHVPHRSGEELAEALARAEEEITQWVGARGSRWGVQGVREQRPAQVVLDRHRRVIRVRGTRVVDDLEGQLVDPLDQGRAAVAGRYSRVRCEPVGIRGAGCLQVGVGGGRVFHGDAVRPARRTGPHVRQPVDVHQQAGSSRWRHQALDPLRSAVDPIQPPWIENDVVVAAGRRDHPDVEARDTQLRVVLPKLGNLLLQDRHSQGPRFWVTPRPVRQQGVVHSSKVRLADKVARLRVLEHHSAIALEG